MNPAVINALAEHIHMDSLNSTGKSIEELKNEIVKVKKYQDNIWQAIENGLSDPDAYKRLEDHKKRLAQLQKDLYEIEQHIDHSREFYLDELNKDADRVMDNPICQRELAHKYIKEILVDDNEILIYTRLRPTQPYLCAR